MDVAPTADRAGSAIPLPAELHRVGFLGRFPPETEPSYRAWLVEQGRPLLRVIAGMSIPFWIAMPYLFKTWVDTPVDGDLYVLSYAVNLPVLILTFLVSFSTRTRIVVPTASVGVVVVATTGFYLFSNILPCRARPDCSDRSSGSTCCRCSYVARSGRRSS